jgi:ethanolamine ammonia-lyase small subunit
MDTRHMSEIVEPNPWDALRRFTQARIALGRSGHSLPSAALLAFNLAHAQARDAVHQALDGQALQQPLQALGYATLEVHSAAPERAQYLRRPDLGRRLDAASRALLLQAANPPQADASCAGAAGPMPMPIPIPSASTVAAAAAAAADAQAPKAPPPAYDLLYVIADGLCARAAQHHALPLLQAMRERLPAWRIAPVVVAHQARVALGDEIGALLAARCVVMLIGERPGLSSPDSLGLYVTYAPQVGCSDAQRNCISNVRPAGLSYDAAAHKLHYLLTQAHRLGFTGVALKDQSTALEASAPLSSLDSP